jgi:rhodanese-related sulfurtransferase
MTFQIISHNTLSRHLYADDILLVDLRSREDYDRAHIPHARWMDWEYATTDIPALWADFEKEHHCPPQWIVLYCDSGHISLITARDLATRGYPVMSLNGGFGQWEGETERS